MKKISVIIPLYHGAGFISDIIYMMNKNLCSSNFSYELELIFINDFPEETVTISEYQRPEVQSLNIIQIQNENNLGIHASRVEGLKHANGEYIMFFDQDDMIGEHYFESQLLHIKKSDVVVANGIVQGADYDKLLYRYSPMHWTVRYPWFYAKFDSRIISPGQCLIKRESIPEAWQQKIMHCNGADDYFLWLMMLQEKKIFCINRECLYTHRYTAVNASLDTEAMHRSVSEGIALFKAEIADKYIRMIETRLRGKGKMHTLVRIAEGINKKRFSIHKCKEK